AAGELVDTGGNPVPLDAVPTSPAGIDYRFRFRSASSGLGTTAPVSSVAVQFVATATKSSLPLATPSFAIDNVPFSVLPQPPSGPEPSGAIELRYVLFSSLPGGELLDIEVEYALNPSGSFQPCAAVPPPLSDGGPQGRNFLRATAAGVSHFFVWNAYLDLLASRANPVAAVPDAVLRLSVRRSSTGVVKGPFAVSSFAVDQRLIYTIFGERSAVVDGIDARTTTLGLPGAVAVFTNELYFADPFTARVRSVDLSQAPPEIGTLFGGGFDLAEGSLASEYFLLNPRGVAVQQPGGAAGSGGIFVTGETPTFVANVQGQVQRVFRIDGATPLVTTLAFRNPVPPPNGPGDVDIFGAIAYESRDDRVYFSDQVIARAGPISGPFGRIIRIRSTQFGPEEVIAGQDAGSAAEGANRNAAFLAEIRGIAVDYSLYPDLVFYTEQTQTNGGRVRVVNLLGTPQTFGVGPALVTIPGDSIVTLLGFGATPPYDQPIAIPSGIVIESNGDLVITETGDHLVTRVSGSDRTRTTIAGTRFVAGFFGDGLPSAQALLAAPSYLARDGAGGLFVTDAGNGRVRQLVRSGGTYSDTRTVAGASPDVLDGRTAPVAVLRSPHAIVPVPGGFAISDTFSGRVRRVQTSDSIISTLAGTGISKISGDGGPPAAANVGAPVGLAVGTANELFIAQGADNVIRRVAGGVITTIAGVGTAGVATDGAPAATSRLLAPRTLARLGSCLVFGQGGAPIASGLVSVVSLDAATPALIAGRTVPPLGIIHIAGSGMTDPTTLGTPAFSTRLASPVGICANPANGSIYVADAGRHVVVEIDASGTMRIVAGQLGMAGGTGDDAGPNTGVNARLNTPTGLCLHPTQPLLIIVDQGNRRVRALNLDPTNQAFALNTTFDAGEIQTVAGMTPSGFLPNDGARATSASLALEGIVVGIQPFVDIMGNLYIPDPGNFRVRVVDDSGVIRTLAGGGISDGEGGPAAAARFALPTALAVAPDGTYYVCDTGRIRRVASGTTSVTTIAGTGFLQTLGSGGPALAASFDFFNADQPFGTVTTDENGIRQIALSSTFGASTGIVTSLLALADTRGGNVHLVNLGATPQTLFLPANPGGVVLQPGQVRKVYPDGVLDRPEGVAFTANGLLLVSDTFADAVLAVNLTNAPVACRGVVAAVGTDAAIYRCRPTETRPRSLAVDVASTFVAIQVDPASGGPHITVLNIAPTGGPDVQLYGSTVSAEGGATPELELSLAAGVTVARGIAIDPVRNEIYYAAPNAARVERFIPTTGPIFAAGAVSERVAGTGAQGFSGDGGLGPNAQVAWPFSLGFDRTGSLYILDGLNFRVRRVRTYPQ
ncbi:MAG: hypothetical protein ACAI25_17090, partial [Planctomycetota bacterium]